MGVPKTDYDVIIIGGGIAGFSAAVYVARANLKVIVLKGPEPGGQLSLTTDVENYPGFPDGIMGPELVANIEKQCTKFGAVIDGGKATKFSKKDDVFSVEIDGEKTVTSLATIIATGASARFLGLPNESDLVGKGVSTCAVCDAAFYKDRVVTVIGGGDSACEEALTLAKFASSVKVVHRRDEMRASKIMQKRVLDAENIDMVWNSTVAEILYDKAGVTGIKVEDVNSGDKTDIACDGMFLAIGHTPNTKIFEGQIELDDHGYIKTSHSITNLPGCYAAGDVQDPVYRQAITSAGTGCEAALEAEKHVEELKAK